MKSKYIFLKTIEGLQCKLKYNFMLILQVMYSRINLLSFFFAHLFFFLKMPIKALYPA